MTNNYDLLVVDIDGTIVGADGAISETDKAAIAAVQSRGVRVALSTGRVIEACRDIIAQLALDGVHIFFDGAAVYDLSAQSMVYSRPVPTETLKAAVGFARANGIYLELYALDRYFVEEINWAEKVHREFFGLTATLADFDDVIGRETVIKCELMIHDTAEEAGAAMLLEHFRGRLTGSVARTPAYPEMKFVNVVEPGVSKGAALAKLAEHFGIDLRRIMAIGDGTNDIPLFMESGLKVAMGNAREELKTMADYITGTVNESGVAAAVERYLL